MTRLCRIPTEGRLGGVCAGIAHYFNADVTLVRLAWVILSIVPGAFVGGALAYAAAWLLMPTSEFPVAVAETGRRLARSTSDRRVAGVCGGLAEYLGVDATVVRIVVIVLSIYPGAIILGLGAYAIAWFIIPDGTRVPPAVSPGVAT